jgi:nucleoside-diphosphate-sugar epimerase|tara:strand:+ start:1713 stop:2504 length:792 start_codon:yes stop_codon:yes gene_type:complete
MKRICIVGLGWLGLELAKELKKKGYYTIGTTTSEVKSQQFRTELDEIYRMEIGLGENLNVSADVLIYTIPPSGSNNYVKGSSAFLNQFNNSNPHASVFYTSSTSVYGNESREINEESDVRPETKSARKIVEVERYIQSHFKNRYIIIRLGGLVGGKRHPVKYLQGKVGVAKPFAPVNLVHREDVIRAIILQISSFTAGIFNLCSGDHPSKKEFYTKLVEQFGLKKVEFNERDKLQDKVVTCIAIKQFNFEFKYKSVYDFVFEL